MRFEWDEAKNEENIRKHGIDFVDVVDMFNHPMLTWEDDRESYGEERWIPAKGQGRRHATHLAWQGRSLIRLAA